MRARGLRAEFEYFGRGLKAQRRQADRLGAALAALIGEDELASGQVTVRDLRSGEQTCVAMDAVVDWAVAALSAASRA